MKFHYAEIGITLFAGVLIGYNLRTPVCAQQTLPCLEGYIVFKNPQTGRLQAQLSSGISGGGGGGIVTVREQTLVFKITGSAKADFILPNAPIDHTKMDVYVNGVLQALTDDYTYNVSTRTVTLLVPAQPASTGVVADIVQIKYLY